MGVIVVSEAHIRSYTLWDLWIDVSICDHEIEKRGRG